MDEPSGGRYFQMNGFARRLVLTPRQKATQKWAIEFRYVPGHFGWLPVQPPPWHVLDEDPWREYPALHVNVIVLPAL